GIAVNGSDPSASHGGSRRFKSYSAHHPSIPYRASGEAGATEEIVESPVAAEAIEGRVDLEVHQRRRAFLARAPQPREGVVRLSEADVDSGDVVRRDVLRSRAVTDELLEHSPR